jgi:hypothetical protein
MSTIARAMCISIGTSIMTMELKKNKWSRCIPKGMLTKTIIPILGVIILFMKTNKCMLIVMQIGLAIMMIINAHQIMFPIE